MEDVRFLQFIVWNNKKKPGKIPGSPLQLLSKRCILKNKEY